MSTTRRVAFNTAAQMAGRIGGMLLALISLKLTTRYLGDNVYGSIAAVSAFVTLFSTLTDWGLVAIASREIAREPERAGEIIGANVAMRFIFGIILVPVVAAAGWIAYHANKPELVGGIAILAVSLIFNAIQSSITAIFAAKVRNELSALLELIGKAVALVGVIVVIKFGFGYYGYIVSVVIMSVIAAFTAYLLAKKFVRVRPVFNLKLWKQLLLISAPLGLAYIINTIYFRIDSVLITFFRPTVEVGYYGVGYKIIDTVMAMGGFFMGALMPYLAVSDMPRVKELIQKAFDALVSLAVPILIGAVLLNRQLIVLISSSDFLPGALPFAVLMIGAAVSYVTGIYNTALITLNHQSKLVRLTLVVVTINIAMNLLLIPRIGIMGAAISNSTSETIAVLYSYYLFTKLTKIKTNFGQLPKTAAAGLVMAGVFLVINNFFPHLKDNSLELMGLIVVLGAAYFGALAMVGGINKDMVKNLAGRS